MNKKISAVLATLIIAGTLTIHKDPTIIEARETKTVKTDAVLVGTWKNTVEKKDAKESNWETFSSKYGTFASTYEYDDSDFAGTLTATQIKVVPKATSLRKELITGRSIFAKDILSQEFNGRVPEPSFSDTVSVSVMDPILGITKTGNIGKAKNINGTIKKPTVVHKETTENYISYGDWRTAGDFFFRFLGNGSDTWSAAGDNSFSFNRHEPLQQYLPYFRFYGDFNKIDDTSFRATHNTQYDDVLSGTKAVGLRWADSRQYTGNELVGQSFFSNGNWISGYDLRDISDQKVFQKNAKGNYATLSRDFDKYVTKKPTTLRTGPGDLYPSVTEDGAEVIIPTGTFFEITMGKYGYYYVAYYKQSDTYMSGSSVKVNPGSWGVGGWVKGSDMELALTATGVPQGGNLNTHRKGAQLLYNLKQYSSVWTQEYEGNVALDDYNKEYIDEWDVYVIYEGEVQDIRLDNFVATKVTIAPTETTLFPTPGQMPRVNDIMLEFEITHESYVDKSLQYEPRVKISLGGVKLWEEKVKINHKGSVTKKVNITNVGISAGDNTFTVEVNSDRKHVERHPTKNPYSDNTKSAINKGIELTTNNIIVSNLSVTPEKTEIPPGDSTIKNTIKVKYDLSHEMNRTPVDSRTFSVPVKISIGGTVLWEGVETLSQRGNRTIEREFQNVIIAKGNNTIKVEANYKVPRVITEVKAGVVNAYLDNVATTNHSGVDPNSNNFKINSVNLYPIRGIVNPEPGVSSVNQKITVVVEIEHELSSNRGTALLSPYLDIEIGGYVHRQRVTMMQGTVTTRTITLPTLAFPISGSTTNFPVEVRVNMHETIPERINNVTDATVYKDNVMTVVFPVTKVPVCELPNSFTKRTTNTWSEKWTKTEYQGTVEGTPGNQICRLSSVRVRETQQNYTESYNVTNVYFRSKWTRDMHLDGKTGFNHLPSEGIGWVKITPDSLVKIKSGYGFEIIATTLYTTNRNRVIVSNGVTYVENEGNGEFTGPLGSGKCNFANVTPSITPVHTPDILFVNIENGAGGNVCSFLWKTQDVKSDWYENEKKFELPLRSTVNGAPERKIYTNENSKPGVYKVTLSTPRPDGGNAFRGYEAETPISLANKGHLFDFITFNLEIMSQDDIKSHISQ